MAAHVPAVTWTSVVPQLQAAGEYQSRRIESNRLGHPLDEGYVGVNFLFRNLSKSSRRAIRSLRVHECQR